MNPQHLTMNARLGWRVLAWIALIAITLVLALLFQALAASASGSPGPVRLTTQCRAALAASNHVRESFLAHLCT